MDQTQLQQKIAEYFEKLPSDLQTVFSDMKWLQNINEISVKYNLSSTQTETFATETTLLLLAIIHVDEYEDILRKELGQSKETVEKIFEEIYSSFLENIQEQLEEAYYENVNSLMEERVINSDWKQNINFVLSGGDYSSFLEEEKVANITKTPDALESFIANSNNLTAALETFNLEITDGKPAGNASHGDVGGEKFNI